MKRDRKLLFNTVFLTCTTLALRAVSMVFQIWLSKRIGAGGLGLYYLILSVDMLAATLAVSGIRFAATRIVAEEAGLGREAEMRAAVGRCAAYAMVLGSLSAGGLYFGAEYIGTVLIGDGRTVLSLKILSFSMPFLSVGAVLSGYFTAVCKVVKSAAEQISEQLVKIAAVAAALSFVPAGDMRLACAAVVTGGVIGEAASFLIILALYLGDVRHVKAGGCRRGMTGRIFKTALPLALSAYVRSALATVQNLLIPRGLKSSGSTPEKALADYGTIQGMVFPVITFPAALFVSLSELLVPELTRAQVGGSHGKIKSIVSRVLRLCTVFSIGIAGILFGLSDELCDTIYNNADVGYYVKLLALFVPVLYMDSVTDGMLRGLGQQLHSMKYNIIEAVVSTVLIYFLIPRFAVPGIIFMCYFSESFNFSMSIRRLSKVTDCGLDLPVIAKAAAAAAASVSITLLVLRTAGAGIHADAFSVALHVVVSCVLYYCLLRLFGALESDDEEWLRRLFSAGDGRETGPGREKSASSRR